MEAKEKSFVGKSLCMFDNEDADEEESTEVKEYDVSDHSFQDTLPSSNTFEAEGEPSDEAGFEVQV